MRGKGSAPPRGHPLPGITPAYAGKREKRVEKIPQIWDHPRVCGEKLRKTAVSVRELGSPPRMRGKEPAYSSIKPARGITPAYAGKSSLKPDYVAIARDHPRVCGEKLPRLLSLALTSGSPPRMRGKDYEKDLKTKERGITPAYAGKSAACPPTPFLCWDHPRVCGEKGMQDVK